MTPSQTAPSTPRLSEVARHVVIPKGIVTTSWPRVVAKCAEVGVSFDCWQHGIGAIALGKREDGKYAATVGGVVLSIPRQVGKTFLVGMIVIALCLLHPRLTVLWSAHRTRTTTRTFHALKAITERAKIKPHMLDPRLSNGEQEIRFRNGSVILFGAREQGLGRGFEEVDIEVFDEAQILSARALEDMVPAANQSRQPSGALLFFMGTPPRPTDPGEEFTNRRKAALAGETDDMVYVELSADKDAKADDRAQWAKANPSYPRRTPVESMRRMRAQLTDEQSYLREALGVWDDESGRLGLFRLPDWARSQDPASQPGAVLHMAAHSTPDRSRSSVAVASLRPDGKLHVELIEHGPGVSWLAGYVKERAKAHRPRAVVVAGGMAAGSLAPELESVSGFATMNATEVRRACGHLYDLVDAGDLAHRSAQELADVLAVAVEAAKRSTGKGEWVFSAAPEIDLSPLYAVALAAWSARGGDPDYDVAGSIF